MSDRTPSLLSGSSNPVVPTLLLLAFSGISYLTLTGRLESRRPKSLEEVLPPTPVGAPGFESAFARLWQDPLDSVYTAEASRTTEATATPCERCIACVFGLDCVGDSSKNRREQIQSQINARVEEALGNGNKKILCMPVLVPGGPYEETREQRRRTRYALLSALGDSGFSLLYPERMSYIKIPCIIAETGPQGRANNVSDLIVPIKIHRREFAANSDSNADPEYSTVFVLWINESRLGARPLHATGQVLEQLFAGVKKKWRDDIDIAILGPSSSGVILKMARDDRHWTQNIKPGNAENCASETLSRVSCPNYFSERFRQSTLYSPRATIHVSRKNDTESDRPTNICLSIVREIVGAFLTPSPCPVPAGASALSTVFSRTMLMNQVDKDTDEEALEHFLTRAGSKHKSGLKVVRMVGDDRQLVSLLKCELKLRRAWPDGGSESDEHHSDSEENGENTSGGAGRKPNPVHTVLITERDTLYGQAFREQFDNMAADNDCIHHFTYLRGIDGQYPHSDKYEARPTKPDESRRDADSGRISAAAGELPHGAGQFDYLRRLGDEIATLRRRLRNDQRADIKSIGLIGTDVYDKLLVLRALRPRFPTVTFFTTDLDARLAHYEELPYTRNLLVASHFALGVDRETFCRTTLPFRDSYQTATYFSVRSAVNPAITEALKLDFDNPWGLGTKTPAAPAPPADEARSATSLRPLMFVIGRQGPYQLTSQKVGKTNEPTDGITNEPAGRSVHPRSPRDETSWLTWGWVITAGWMMVLLATVAYCAFSRHEPGNSPHYENSLLMWMGLLLVFVAAPTSLLFNADNLRGAFTAFLLIASLCTLAVASMLSSERLRDNVRKAVCDAVTAGKNGPQHESSFAALLIASAGFLILLAIATYDHLRPNGQAVEFSSGLSVWPPTFIRLFAFALSVYCIFRIWHKLSGTCEVMRDRYGPSSIMQRYVDECTARRLFTRVAVWGVGFLFSIVAVCQFTEYPAISYRGEVAYWSAQFVLWSSAVCVLAVIILVLDSMFRAQRFVCDLGREHCDWQSVNCSEYKSEVAERFWHPARPHQGPAPPPFDSLNELLTVRLIAEHTRIVGPFVYLPFILLTIMLFARHGLVDHSYLPPGIIIVIAFFMGLLVIAGYLLRRRADVAKSIALGRLQQQLSAAQATSNRRRLAEQINIIIAEVKAERRGAFKPISDDPLLGALAVPSVVVALLLLAERYTVP